MGQVDLSSDSDFWSYVHADTLKTRLQTESRHLDSVFDRHLSCGARLPGLPFQLCHLLAVQPFMTYFIPNLQFPLNLGILGEHLVREQM